MFALFCSQDNECYVPLAKKKRIYSSGIRRLFTTSDLMVNLLSLIMFGILNVKFSPVKSYFVCMFMCPCSSSFAV